MPQPVEVRDGVEHFAFGARRYYLNGGAIVVLCNGDDRSPQAIDVYIDVLVESINHFPDPHTTYLIIHTPNPNVSLTPHARRRAMEVFRRINADRTVYIAAIYGSATIAMLVSLLVRTTLSTFRLNAVFRVAASIEEAVEWLEERRSLEHRGQTVRR